MNWTRCDKTNDAGWEVSHDSDYPKTTSIKDDSNSTISYQEATVSGLGSNWTFPIWFDGRGAVNMRLLVERTFSKMALSESQFSLAEQRRYMAGASTAEASTLRTI